MKSLIFVVMKIAVITGDLVNSATAGPEGWMDMLRHFLNRQGTSPERWEIFRGDSFQFTCDPPDALFEFLILKSMVKQIADLDVRVSIGVGTADYKASRITESNGEAFVRSGRTFDSMKDKQYLAFCTGTEQADRTLNLLAAFASVIMDGWTAAVSETVQTILEYPDWNQQQVAEKLKINQSAVSQNRKRAQLDLILEMNAYYKTTVTSLPA